MRTKIILLILAAVLLATGCDAIMEKNEFSSASPSADEAKPLHDIYWIDDPYIASAFYAVERWQYSISDQTNDRKLQDAVSEMEVYYPIESDEQIQTYAWRLYGICMDRELFSPDLIPVGAMHFSDDMWFLSYIPAEFAGSYYDGPAALFLISGTDGHIIHYEIEASDNGEA